MVWLVLVALALAAGLTFGFVASVVRTRGKSVAWRSAAVLAAAFLLAGGSAYVVYLETRHGSLPPDHIYNSVLGNLAVVGGLVLSVGGLIGLAAAIALILRGDSR